MRERDIFEEIIDIGKRRGTLTYDEINDALPSEFFSPDELEDLMDLLQDMGVKVIEEGVLSEEEMAEEEETVEYEKTEDLVQAYFHSMGDISILTKDEETELAKRLEEGREIMTKAELIAAVAGEAQVRKVDAEKAINSLIAYRSLRYGRHLDLILTDQHSFCGDDPTDAEGVERIYDPAFNGMFSPIEPTLALIRRLKGRYRLGLLSNTNEWHFRGHIATVPVFPLFDTVTLSYEVREMKPGERIYRDALGKLGLPPESCVFIDDIEENVAAAGIVLDDPQYDVLTALVSRD